MGVLKMAAKVVKVVAVATAVTLSAAACVGQALAERDRAVDQLLDLCLSGKKEEFRAKVLQPDTATHAMLGTAVSERYRFEIHRAQTADSSQKRREASLRAKDYARLYEEMHCVRTGADLPLTA